LSPANIVLHASDETDVAAGLVVDDDAGVDVCPHDPTDMLSNGMASVEAPEPIRNLPELAFGNVLQISTLTFPLLRSAVGVPTVAEKASNWPMTPSVVIRGEYVMVSHVPSPV